jgi:hypothetical protein
MDLPDINTEFFDSWKHNPPPTTVCCMSDEVQIVLLEESEAEIFTRYLYAKWLNGCFAVAIVSPRAAILAQISPQLPHKVREIMSQVRAKYGQHPEHFYGRGTHCWVVVAVPNGSEALPMQSEIIKDVIREELYLPFKTIKYQVVVEGEPIHPLKGSVIIIGETPNKSLLMGSP